MRHIEDWLSKLSSKASTLVAKGSHVAKPYLKSIGGALLPYPDREGP